MDTRTANTGRTVESTSYESTTDPTRYYYESTTNPTRIQHDTTTEALRIQHEFNTVLLRKHYEIMSLTYDKSDDPYVPPSPMTKTKMTT